MHEIFKSFLFLDHVSNFFRLRYRFQALTERNLIFEFSLSETFCMSNLKGLTKSSFSPKGPMTNKILKFETLVIADYDKINISKFEGCV